MKANGDANNDQVVDAADLAVWEAQFVLLAAIVDVDAAARAEFVPQAQMSSNSGSALSAELVDLAVAQALAEKSIYNMVRRDRAVVRQRILSDGAARSLQHRFDAASDRRDTPQPSEASRCRPQSRAAELSVAGVDNGPRGAVVDSLFERLS
jgi:hypothetical protein